MYVYELQGPMDVFENVFVASILLVRDKTLITSLNTVRFSNLFFLKFFTT